MHKTIFIIFFTVVIIFSCGPSEKFDVFVSDGLQPEISWEYSNRGISQLFITDISIDTSFKEIWAISTDMKYKLNSPIKYGDYSTMDTNKIFIETAISDDTDSLELGKTYRVELWNGNDHGQCEFVATQEKDN